MSLVIPVLVKRILVMLEKAGYEAYVVGGAVRDLLLGKEPADFDIVSAAGVELAEKLAAENNLRVLANYPGRRFGVALLSDGADTVEVAAFRSEIYGEDAHRPSAVSFQATLRDDLARRDFTVNALAMGADGTVIDYFDGQRDLKNKVLRMIGLPEERFGEDALRMFRACRLVSQLGFTVFEDIVPAIRGSLRRVAGLSADRIRPELEKLLLGEHVTEGMAMLTESGLAGASCRHKCRGEECSVALLPELYQLVGLEQNTKFHQYDVWRHTLCALAGSEADLTVRWAMLLHDVGKGCPEVRGINSEGQPTAHQHEKYSAVIAEDILSRLGYGEEFRREVVWLVARHMLPGFYLYVSLEATLKWVRKEAMSGRFSGTEELLRAFHKLHAVCYADINATKATKATKERMEDYWRKVFLIVQAMPASTKDLAIKGQALLSFVPAAEMKELMPYLLRRVQEGSLANCRDELLRAAHAWQNRHQAAGDCPV